MDIPPLHLSQHLGNRIIDTQGKTYDYYAGTSYLGLNADGAFKAHLDKGFETFGHSFGVSRYGNIQASILEEFDQAVAEFLRQSKVMSLSSGYLACQIALQTLVPQFSQVFVSPKTHPAILPSGYSIFEGSFDEWFAFLETQDADQSTLIISDAVNATLGQQTHLERIPSKFDTEHTTLLIDESHSLGVLGQKGEGISHTLKSHFSHLHLICTASLHKALGTPGGVIYGDLDTQPSLTQHLALSGGSPILPAYAYAFVSHVHRELAFLHTELKNRINEFRDLTKSYNIYEHFFVNENLPAFAHKFAHLNTYHQLLSEGVAPSCFRYPLPTSDMYIRFVINIHHSTKQLDRLCSILSRIE